LFDDGDKRKAKRGKRKEKKQKAKCKKAKSKKQKKKAKSKKKKKKKKNEKKIDFSVQGFEPWSPDSESDALTNYAIQKSFSLLVPSF
jgi:hypothetical protein